MLMVGAVNQFCVSYLWLHRVPSTVPHRFKSRQDGQAWKVAYRMMAGFTGRIFEVQSLLTTLTREKFHSFGTFAALAEA
ncbi:hypothetical protein AA3271_2245 [Gluconobacter japonicus NBRC 3271]|nr:hypothetical protein AA3271_2245 [Gluconobacter japonicus NBRC 3271]